MPDPHTLCIPINFGERFEDRSLLAASAAEGGEKCATFRCMVRAWQDFATDRETSRLVPADAEVRAQSQTVRIIEDFCGWPGRPGRFVSLALETGFMVARQENNGMLRLHLAGFDLANRRAPDSRSLGRLGGIGRARNLAAKAAVKDADDLLELFRRHHHGIIADLGPEKIHAALVFIGQVSRLLQWSQPADQAFLTTLVPKALQTIADLGADKDEFLAWLVTQRDSGTLPGRIDLLFDAAAALNSHRKQPP